MKKLILLLMPLSFLCIMAQAQVDDEDNFKVIGKDTIYPLKDGRILFNERIYRENASYMTFAYGAGKNFRQGGLEQDLMVGYHHFINNIGISIGYHASSDIQVWWRSYQKLNDLWLGAGWRHESLRYNLGIFAGPSFSYGSYIAWSEPRQEDRAYGFTTLGGVAEIQLTYKLLYDLGLGLSLYGSYNRYYAVAGAQIHLFFSTAFVRNY